MTTLIPKIDFKNGGTTPVGAINRNIDIKLQEIVNVEDFGGDTASSDNSTAINNALTYLSGKGGGVLNLNPGTYFIADTIAMPDNCSIQGAGQYATTIKLANSANVNLIESADGSGFGIGIFDMTFDGNQTNNTSGGLFLQGATNVRGPMFNIQRITVTHCRNCVMDSGIKSSFYLGGNGWNVIRDIDIYQNDYCQNALWVGCPDSQFNGVYLGTNGRSAPSNYYNCGMFVTGASNLFTNCYFGGTQQNAQIFFQDVSGSVNKFVACIVDNAGGNGVQFENGADGNVFIGCSIGNSSYSDGGTYYSIYNTSAVGAGGVFIGCQIYSNYATAYATNGYKEPSYLAGNSKFVGCTFSGTFTSGPVALGTGSTTTFSGTNGYSISTNVPTTVSGLPSASITTKGSTAFVSDANATTFASIVAGGGSNAVPVYFDGTNWRIG